MNNLHTKAEKGPEVLPGLLPISFCRLFYRIDILRPLLVFYSTILLPLLSAFFAKIRTQPDIAHAIKNDSVRMIVLHKFP